MNRKSNFFICPNDPKNQILLYFQQQKESVLLDVHKNSEYHAPMTQRQKQKGKINLKSSNYLHHLEISSVAS